MKELLLLIDEAVQNTILVLATLITLALLAVTPSFAMEYLFDLKGNPSWGMRIAIAISFYLTIAVAVSIFINTVYNPVKKAIELVKSRVAIKNFLHEAEVLANEKVEVS